MPEWYENLTTLDTSGLVPVLDSHRHENDVVELEENITFRRRARARGFTDATSIANAAAHIGRLPAPGESLHMVTKGNYEFLSHVPAMLSLIAPATIRRLTVTTLGFSAANMRLLLDLLDAGQIGELWFMASHYFSKMTDGREVCQAFADELRKRPGSRFAVSRSHCKLYLFENTDGERYVIETSANARSCRCSEFAILTHDDCGLLDFHFSWLRKIFDACQ